METRSRLWTAISAVSIGTLIVVVFGAIIARGAADDAHAATTDQTRQVTVNGEGHVLLPPDTAYLSLGVDISDPDLSAAQSQAATTMNAVLTALTNAGVAEADIQTGTYSIYVDRDYNQKSQPIVGYHVVHTVTAKVHNLSAAGDTLAAAIGAGANTVGGISFGLENPGAAIAQARELAVADARAKAEDLARLSDSNLGPVLTISESSTSPSAPVAYQRNSDMVTAEGAVAPPLNPGQAEVDLVVTISYVLN